jgi:hypothetical protein
MCYSKPKPLRDSKAEVLTAATMKLAVYWGAMPYSLLQFVCNSGLQPGVRISPGLLEDMLEHLKGVCKIKKSGPDLGLATGDLDVGTSHLIEKSMSITCSMIYICFVKVSLFLY